MTPPGPEQLATAIRGATTDAGKKALEGFCAAAVLALGDVAVTCIREHASIGADALAKTMASAYASDVVGRVVTDADANGLSIGDVRVSTQLAQFASGVPMKSPIGRISVQHQLPFALAGCGALEASGTLTLHASCEPGDAHQLETSAWGKIELKLEWSTEEKKPAAAP